MTKADLRYENWLEYGRRILGGVLLLAPLGTPILAAGCTVNSATSDTCSANSNVSCSNGVGYTCSGTALPPSSAGQCNSIDNTGDFCCVESGTCGVSSSVVCTGGNGTGYLCTGAAQPAQTNPNLVCNTNGTGAFCCVASTTCTYDSNVIGCESGTLGYSCASGDAPPDATDSALVCSVPTTESGLDEYCCFTNTTTAPGTSTCQPDSSVAGCQPDSAGNPSYRFSCTGSENPDTDFSNITCSTQGTPGSDSQGNAALLYCCTYH